MNILYISFLFTLQDNLMTRWTYIYMNLWVCVSVSEEMWNDVVVVVGGYESVLPTEKHDDTSPDYVESSSLFFQKSSESFARYFLLGISITISWWIFFTCIHIFSCFSLIGLLSSEETQERRVFIEKRHVCGDESWVVQSKNSDTTRRGSRPDTPQKNLILKMFILPHHHGNRDKCG